MLLLIYFRVFAGLLEPSGRTVPCSLFPFPFSLLFPAFGQTRRTLDPLKNSKSKLDPDRDRVGTGQGLRVPAPLWALGLN